MTRVLWLLVLVPLAAPGFDGGSETEVFVQASTALLRAGPMPTAKVRGRLQINTPVSVLARRDGFVEVRVRNGRVGWLDERLVAARPLTSTAAIEAARGAATPEDALTWWQRAAALDGNDVAVLQSLAEAYAKVGNQADAAAMASLAQYRSTRVFPIVWSSDNENAIELVRLSYEKPLPNGPLPRSEWAKLGLSLDRPLWVLPSGSAAVPGTVREVRVTTWNECGDDIGFDAIIDVELPAGERAVAATFGERPEGWKRRPARAATSMSLPAELVTKDGTRYRFVARTDPDSERDIEHDSVVATWSEAKKTRSAKLWLPSRARSVTVRDVLGDAQPEFIVQTSCQTLIFSASGETLNLTQMRCCGC
ncbi:MAG: SH3 domain-containing protein [Archangium sp.]